VIAQHLVSYCLLCRLRQSATSAGLSHRSCTLSCVSWLLQLNRCSMECHADIYIPPLTGKPEQQRITIRSVTLTITSSRQCGAISGCQNEWTLDPQLQRDKPALFSSQLHYGLHPALSKTQPCVLRNSIPIPELPFFDQELISYQYASCSSCC